MMEYTIESIDYWEKDAILVIGSETFYFQWDGLSKPTLLDAVRFLHQEAIRK